MMSTTGANTLYAQISYPGNQKTVISRENTLALDPIKSFQRIKEESRKSKERICFDSTTELLQTKGFLEKLGPEKIYMSDTTSFFQYPPAYQSEVLRCLNHI